MRKKLVSLALIGGIMLTLCACGGTTNSDTTNVATQGNAEAKTELETAVEGLKGITDTYIVSTSLETPSDNSSYIEIVGDGFNYTEYPVDSDGNVVSTLSDDEGNSYMLSDWMTEDKFYTYATDSDDNVGFYTLPDSYREICADRTSLYADKLLAGASNITKSDESLTADLGDGEQTYEIYEATISSDAIYNVMKVGSYDLYDSLKTAYPDNENLVTYAGYMTDELGFNLVFGNAKATFAVSNGVLRYYQLEIGGLGTRMYLTKTVLISDTDVRETPDFSDAGDYADLLQETADYVAQYDSYEDALNAMYSSSDSTDTTIDYDDIEIVTEDEEGTPTDSDTE